MRSFSLLFLGLWIFNSLFAQQKDEARIASLKKSIVQSEESIEKISLLHQLTQELIQNNLPEATLFAEQALKLAQKLQNRSKEAESLVYLGLAQSNQGNDNQALNHHLKVLGFMDVMNDRELITLNSLALGNIYQNLKKDTYTALQYYFQAYILTQEGDFAKKGEKMAQALKGIASTYNNLMRYHLNRQEESKANYYNKLYQDYQIKYQSLVASNYDVNTLIQKQEEEGRIYTAPNPSVRADNVPAERLNKRRSEIAKELERLNDSKILNLENTQRKVQLQHEHDSLVILEKEWVIEDFRSKHQNNEARIKQIKKEKSEEIAYHQNSKFWWVTGLCSLFAVTLLYIAWQLHKKGKVIDNQQGKLVLHQETINRQKITLREKDDKLINKEAELAFTLAKLDDAKMEIQNLTHTFTEEVRPLLDYIIQNVLEDDINQLAIYQNAKQIALVLYHLENLQNSTSFLHKLTIEQASVYKIAHKSIEQIAELARLKNIQIENKIKPFYFASLDTDCMEKVFLSLFANAIKYSPKGGKIILESMPITQNSNHFIKISLSDNGQPIPQSVLNLVYDTYSPEEARPSGLGLSFVKMAVEAHNGKVDVISDKEEGVSFIFTLPEIKAQEVVEHNALLNDNEVDELVSARTSMLLNDKEQKALLPYLIKLHQMDVFETSAIKALLNQIQHLDNENIRNWKKEVEEAIFCVNEEKYKELIKLF